MDNTQKKILDLVKGVNPDNPLSYVLNAVKPLAKEVLDNAILECNDCEIACNSVKSLTKGNPNGSILIIGESVTTDQQESNEECVYPFEDDYKEALTNILDSFNVNYDQLFFINSVNCFPNRNGKKRGATVNERNNCKCFLDYAIKMVEPLMIICLGAVSVNGINEEIGKQKITDIRGNFFQYRGIDVMPTFHPRFFKELTEKSMPECVIDEYYNEFFSDLNLAFTTFAEKYPKIKIFNTED